MSSRRFNSNKVGSTSESDEDYEEGFRLRNMAVPETSDFLARISPPVVNQPQAFTDDMLDPTSRALMSGITSAHTDGASLQETLRQEARQLQQTVHEQFFSVNKGNMTYKELLKGLIHEGETLQTWSNFTFLTYTHLRFCDESDTKVNERSSGICLLTDKRLLFLSSQLAIATSLVPWGDPKNLPGGYSLQTTFNDTTCYLPIPLRCFRSIEMSGHTGLRGEVKVHGVAPCCCGLFQLCAFCCCPSSNMMGQWSSQPANLRHVQEMEVTVGVLMPPWGRKTFVHIRVDPNVPLPVTRDFIALLQKNATGLS